MAYSFLNDERMTPEGFSKFKQTVEYFVQHPGIAGENKFCFPKENFDDSDGRIIIEFDYETIRKEQALLEEKKKELANIKRSLFERMFKEPPKPQINVSDNAVKVTMEIRTDDGKYTSDYDSEIGTEMMSYDKFMDFNYPIFHMKFIKEKFEAIGKRFGAAGK